MNSSPSCLHLLSAGMTGAHYSFLIFSLIFVFIYLDNDSCPILLHPPPWSLWPFGSPWRHSLILIFEWDVSIFQQYLCMTSSQWLCKLRRAKLLLYYKWGSWGSEEVPTVCCHVTLIRCLLLSLACLRLLTMLQIHSEFLCLHSFFEEKN